MHQGVICIKTLTSIPRRHVIWYQQTAPNALMFTPVITFIAKGQEGKRLELDGTNEVPIPNKKHFT